MTESPSEVIRGPRQAQLLLQVRFRHVLAALCAARHGFGVVSHFEGDALEGLWHSDHDSNGLVVAWNPSGAVVLSLENGSFSFNRELSTAQLFAGAPASLEPLVAAVVARTEEHGPPTAALWFPGVFEGRELMKCRNRSERLDQLMLPPLEVFSGEAGLQDLNGLADEDGALALALAERSVAGATAITPEEEAAIFTARAEDDPVPQLENIRQAIELFRQVGIAWPEAEATALRVGQEALRHRLLGDTDRGLALLKAVEHGDLELVRELAASGANLEKPSPPGWVRHSHDGETPLLVAVGLRREDIARCLLDHGADPNSQVGGHTPLGVAATRCHVALCTLLLERGARLTIPWHGETSVLEPCRYHRDPIVIRLLLEAGAPLPDRRTCEDLARIARDAGAEDLVPRLTRD